MAKACIKSLRVLGSIGLLLCLAFVGRTAANPTHAPPPPIRTYSFVPLPPSPPPGLIASFSPESEFSTAKLGSWKAGQTINPNVGLLVAQATGTTVSVYGVLSGLTPSANLTCVVAETSCADLVQLAGQGITAVAGSGGAVILEGALGSTLTALSAQVLARSGFAGVYNSAGKLLMCTQLRVVANTQVVLIGRMPAQFNQRTAQGLAILRREAVMGNSEMHMTGIIFGLESEFHGMWHFHRGFNCLAATEDVNVYKGIYASYETGRTSVRGGDPWTYGSYRSDPRGVALISKTMRLDSPDFLNTISREMAEFKGECGGAMPSTFVGRQMIVHGRAGSYIGCGSVAGYMPGVTDAIAVLNKHYRGNLDPKTLVHINENDAGLHITAVLSGLAARQDVQIHIHAGFECPRPDEALSMLNSLSQQSDPTSVQLGTSLLVLTPAKTDSFGNVFYQTNISSTTLSLSFLAGRVMTIQDKTSSVALNCGTIEPTTLLVVPVVPSATVVPSADVSFVGGGLIMAAQAGSGVALRGTVLMTAALEVEALCVVSFTSSCEDTANPIIPEIILSANDVGACQLTQHILGVSVDPLTSGGAFLRGAVVTVSGGAGDPICGRLVGPLSEVPTPDPNICNVSDKLRGASIGFIVLSTIVLLLFTAISLLLRADAAEKIVVSVSTRVSISLVKLGQTSNASLKKAKESMSSTRNLLSLDRSRSRSSLYGDLRDRHTAGSHQGGAHVNDWLLDGISVDTDTTPNVAIVHNVSKRFQLKASPFASSRKPRLLALHGMGSNKDVTKRQLRNLGITEELFTIVYLNGPVNEKHMGPGLEGLFEGPFYSWYDKGAVDKDTVLEMLGSVVLFIQNNNIDGVFGFSQGGGVLSAIMQPEVRELLCSYLGVRLRSKNQYHNANFDLSFCMLAHSASSELVRKTLGLQPQAAVNTINGHSIHLIGISDPGKPKSEAEALIFNGGVKRLIVYHAGAHQLPRELETNELLYIRVMTRIGESLKPESSSSRATAHVISEDEFTNSVAKEVIAKGATLECEQETVDVAFPKELNGAPGAVHSIKHAEGEKMFFADHLTVPTTAKTLSWQPISKFSSVSVSPLQQLVRVKVSPDADDHPCTLRGLLTAQPHDAPCIRTASDPSISLTYGQLHDFMAPGGKGDLSAIGVKTSDSVIYVAPGGAVAAVAFLTIASQCTAAPLDITVMQADAEDAIEQFKSKHVIIFDKAPADGIRAAAEAIKAAGKIMYIHTAQIGDDALPGLFELIPDPAMRQTLYDLKPLETGEDDVVLLLRTSGTTSKPKGVPLRQGAIVRNGLLLSGTIEISEKDVCLNAMPLFHIGGLSASVLATLASGGSITCLDSFSAEKFNAALAAEPQPTWYSAVPTIHMAVVNHLKDEGITPNHSLRFIRSGAAALTPADGEALSACYGNIPIHGTYSMSEQMPISQPDVGLDQLHEKNGSVGIACAASMAIVNPSTLSPQPPGVQGVIAISGPTVMRNYLRNPKADAENFFLLSCADGTSPEDSDRFFLTGDVGILDSDGHLTIKGRSKELIKRGGEQVSPYEVEDALKNQEWVRMAVVFGVPSPAIWGEEVGCVIILEPTAPEEAQTPKVLLKEMRSACRTKGLGPNKWPTVAAVTTWKDLPKTKTNKPIRTGLAEALGIKSATIGAQTSNRKGPPRISRATEGVRFFLACQVVFNHVGIQSPGPGDRMPDDPVQPDESWGAFGQARFMCIHVPTFFALAGFGMSASMGPAPRSKIGFIAARLSPMYPMYILSITLLLINTLAMCRPDNFDPNFHYKGQADDLSRGDFCEPAPLVESYWGSLFATIFVYLFALQSWPVYMFSWFLSYYTWFSSVYFSMLFAHPFFYSPMIAIRGRIKLIWSVTACVVALNYCVVAGWFIGWFKSRTFDGNLAADRLGSRDDEADFTGQFSLMYYLFPPFWLPTYGLGICAAFLFDYYRPNEQHSKWKWGIITDLLSFMLVFCGYIYYPLTASCLQKEGLLCPSVEPDPSHLAIDHMGLEQALGVMETDSIGTRTIAGIWSRFLLPVMVLWLYGLATGEGYSVKFFTLPLLTDTLAPISYNIYLFHQYVAQIYFLATRAEWWSFWRHRKAFFWFSPSPVPVGYGEYFYIVILTTFLSFGLAKIDPWMISKWEVGRGKFRKLLFPDGEKREDLTTMQVVLLGVERLTGAGVEPDWTLAECGLSSVAGPVIINMLTTAVPGVTLSLADLVEVNTIGGLANLLELRKKEMNATGLGTTTTTKDADSGY